MVKSVRLAVECMSQSRYGLRYDFVHGFSFSSEEDLFIIKWNYVQIKEGLLSIRDTLKLGDVRDVSVFIGAVIDAAAFKRISGYIEHAKKSSNLEIIGGGKCDESYVSLCMEFIKPGVPFMFSLN